MKIVYSVFDVTNVNSDSSLNFLFSSANLIENYDTAMNFCGLKPVVDNPKFIEVEDFFRGVFSGVFVIRGSERVCQINKSVI